MKIRHLEVRHFRGIKSLAWSITGDFNCIIGRGDACKTTILSALDYALAPRTSLTFDDADFFDQDVSHDIVIQVTLSDWDSSQEQTRKLLQESTFAQFQCGLTEAGPTPEPDERVALSISLRIDKSLEPKWFVVKGRDEGEGIARKAIYAVDRDAIGLSRIDFFSDGHFTWGRNTILTRLSQGAKLTGVVADLARDMRQSDISAHPSVAQCKTVAEQIRTEARASGVSLAELMPRIDVQKQTIGAGVISLHEGQVPLRGKGSGSKRLIAAAMQMKLHGGKNIAVIDEIELGLEPHRIRGLLLRLKASQQQIFATTHSAAVLRELDVSKNELWVCLRDKLGNVSVKNLNTVTDIQGPVRSNAEAFLGSRIVACEGPTEVGLLRAYDLYKLDATTPPAWSLATAYFNCAGASNICRDATALKELGFRTAVLCDNDAPEHLSEKDIAAMETAGIHVTHWDEKKATEHQLFADIPWPNLPGLLAKISEAHDTLELASMVDGIVKDSRVSALKLTADVSTWQDQTVLRAVIGDIAHSRKWIKRIDYARTCFMFALPYLPEDGVLKLRMKRLWDWVQRDD